MNTEQTIADFSISQKNIALQYIEQINTLLKDEKNIDDFFGFRDGKNLEVNGASSYDETYKYDHFGKAIVIYYDILGEITTVELIKTPKYYTLYIRFIEEGSMISEFLYNFDLYYDKAFNDTILKRIKDDLDDEND